MEFNTWQKFFAIAFVIAAVVRITSKPASERPCYARNSNYPPVIAHQGGDGIITDRPDIMMDVLGR